jgi:CRP-like cAMP-binding protein
MSLQVTIEQLARVRVLQNLETPALAALLPHTRLRSYRKGEIVFQEGDPLPAQLHVLIDGILSIKKTASTGKETLVRTLPAGEIFAAPAVFGNRIAPAMVVAHVDSLVLTLEREALLDTIRQTPEVALQILQVFNQRLQRLHNTVHGLISERAIVRLARLIDYYATEYGTESTPKGDCLNVKLSYYQMARSIGITYEECARLVKSIDSIVTYQRGGTIIVRDWDKLEAIAL